MQIHEHHACNHWMGKMRAKGFLKRALIIGAVTGLIVSVLGELMRPGFAIPIGIASGIGVDRGVEAIWPMP